MLVPDAKYLLDYDPLPVNQAATLCAPASPPTARSSAWSTVRGSAMLLIGLGGVGMMGLFRAGDVPQGIAVADLSVAARGRTEE